MDKRKDIQDELREIAPGLEGLPKDNPFRVPEGYFSALPGEVMRKLQRQESPAPVAQQPAGWWQRFMEQLDIALAAVLRPASRWLSGVAPLIAVVVLAVGMLLLPGTPDTPATAGMEAVSDEEVTAFIAGNIDEFEDELLYEQTMAGLNGSPELNIFESTDATELDEYILDNIDEETIQEVML